MPRSKNTSRAQARRRHREQQREIEPNTLSDQAEVEDQAPPSRPAFALPNVREDIKALPEVFRKPLVWAPFGLLLLAFVLAIAVVSQTIPPGDIANVAWMGVQFTLPPTSLFIFFIGGFVAPRASYLVGGLLGAFDALLMIAFLTLQPSLSTEEERAASELGALEGGAADLTVEGAIQLTAMAIFIGVLAAGFAAWYRRFLRSSQERARINRAAKEKAQAEKAKEQARADKQAARDARKR